MSVEAKVLSASTRTNLEALKHHMKKLGFKYFEESHGWTYFCMNVLEKLMSLLLLRIAYVYPLAFLVSQFKQMD